MLQKRNSVLQRQINRVLRSNIIKVTSKKNRSSNSFKNCDININSLGSMAEEDKVNSIKYVDILTNSECQGAVWKNASQSQPNTDNKWWYDPSSSWGYWQCHNNRKYQNWPCLFDYKEQNWQKI